MTMHGRIPLSWERKTGLPITSECLHGNSELWAAQMLVPLARHSIHDAALQACDSRLEAQVWGRPPWKAQRQSGASPLVDRKMEVTRLAADALQISLNAIYGRVFFVQFGLDTLQSWLATAESVIEGVFVAMIIQRLFR